jgi:hypothetical protein
MLVGVRILNVSLVGTPGGPTVRVMCLAGLFPYLTTVSLVHHYIHLVSRTEDMCLADLFPYLTVRVMCLADLFPYLTVVSLVHYIYIYIHLVSRTEERDGSLYSLRCNSLIIVKIADWHPWFFLARVFHVKIVSRVRSCFRIIC